LALLSLTASLPIYVYALGVLLYLLLTGQHPAGRAVRSPATLIRAIVDTEAPRVSDAVVTGAEGDDLSRHAAHCGTTLPRLRRALRGDLDTIVAKALKKNAAERYPSVTALAEDLARYLRHEPIGARPDSIRYRAARFVQRHAIGVATAAAVGSLVVGLTIFHTARLSAERDRAQRETAKAVKVSDMLMQVLTSADPYTIRDSSGQPSLRALLDAGTTQVKTQFASEPDVQADMLTTLGRSYRRMGEYDKAQGLLEQALAAGQRAFGSEHIRIAQTLDYLGTVLADKGDYGAAGRSLERALAMRRKLLGPAHPDVAVTLVELGRIYQDNGLNARAEPLHRESLQIRRATLGPEHREVAVSLSDLASVLRLNGDLAGAESLLRECLQINRKTRGEEHPNTATTLHDLALIAAAGGDYRSAEAQLRVVLDMQRRTLGDSHPLLATTLNSLAHVLVRTGRYAEARQQLERALAIVRPVFNRDHQAIAIDSLNLAAVDMALNAPAAAEPLLREGIRIRALAPGLVPMRRRTLLEDDWSVGAAKSLLGAALVALKRYDEAEATLLDARRELEAATQPQPREIATALTRLIDLYAAWGKPDRAAAFRARLAS
jgi:tetratricopeptide (TPR) repeat protein